MWENKAKIKNTIIPKAIICVSRGTGNKRLGFLVTIAVRAGTSGVGVSISPLSYRKPPSFAHWGSIFRPLLTNLLTLITPLAYRRRLQFTG